MGSCKGGKIYPICDGVRGLRKPPIIRYLPSASPSPTTEGRMVLPPARPTEQSSRVPLGARLPVVAVQGPVCYGAGYPKRYLSYSRRCTESGVVTAAPEPEHRRLPLRQHVGWCLAPQAWEPLTREAGTPAPRRGKAPRWRRGLLNPARLRAHFTRSELTRRPADGTCTDGVSGFSKRSPVGEQGCAGQPPLVPGNGNLNN